MAPVERTSHRVRKRDEHVHVPPDSRENILNVLIPVDEANILKVPEPVVNREILNGPKDEQLITKVDEVNQGWCEAAVIGSLAPAASTQLCLDQPMPGQPTQLCLDQPVSLLSEVVPWNRLHSVWKRGSLSRDPPFLFSSR